MHEHDEIVFVPIKYQSLHGASSGTAVCMSMCAHSLGFVSSFPCLFVAWLKSPCRYLCAGWRAETMWSCMIRTLPVEQKKKSLFSTEADVGEAAVKESHT